MLSIFFLLREEDAAVVVFILLIIFAQIRADFYGGVIHTKFVSLCLFCANVLLFTHFSCNGN